jgi:hypothetical protein
MKMLELKPSLKPTDVAMPTVRAEWLEGIPPVFQSRVRKTSRRDLALALKREMTALISWVMKRLNEAERKIGFEKNRSSWSFSGFAISILLYPF